MLYFDSSIKRSPLMTYTKIKLSKSLTFPEIRLLATDYYLLRDVSAEGGYSIVLELSSNGMINNRI